MLYMTFWHSLLIALDSITHVPVKNRLFLEVGWDMLVLTWASLL